MGCHGGSHEGHSENKGQSSALNGLKTFTILVFAIGGGYYLLTAHQAHIFRYWPFVLFLLCPLMHLVGGHGGHGGNGSSAEDDESGHSHQSNEKKRGL